MSSTSSPGSRARTSLAARIAISLVAITAAGCAMQATVPLAPAAADAEAKRFVAAPKLASVYVYRDERGASLETFEVFVDGKSVGRTAPFTYIKVQVPPGMHRVTGRAGNDAELLIAARAGELYFVQQQTRMGWTKPNNSLELVVPEEGQAAVAKCMLVQATSP